MEAIREYLNNMFMNLPETPEVLRAKAELLQMMEDKYEEMINEGKSEQEAVGTVISEFGNLEELAKELGIEVYMKKGENKNDGGAAAANQAAGAEQNWGLDETKDYIKYTWKHAALVALGVMLCIWAPYMSSVMDGAQSSGYVSNLVAEAVGSSILFFLVAIAVALFIVASSMTKKYGKIAKYCIITDASAQKFMDEKRDKDDQTRLVARVIGIAFCILSVVPASTMNFIDNMAARAAVDSSVLIIVGIGVFLLVLSCSVGNRYEAFDKAVENGFAGRGGQMPPNGYPGRKKKGMPLAIVLILIFAGFLILAVNIGLGIAYSVNDSKDSKSVEEASEYAVDGIEQINVNLDAANIYIEQGDVKSIEYKYSGSSNYVPSVTNNGGTLKVEEKGDGNFWGFHFNIGFVLNNSGKRSVTITVPRQKEIEYYVDADAGNVEFRNLDSNSKITAEVDAGNVVANNCTIMKGKIDIDAGNIKLNDSKIYNIQAEVDAGNFSYDSKLPLNCYDMDFETDLGSVYENGRKLGGSHTAQASENCPDSVDEDVKMNVNVDMGNIEVSDSTGN